MYGRGGRGCDGKNLETLRKVGEEAKRANRLLKRKYGLVKA